MTSRPAAWAFALALALGVLPSTAATESAAGVFVLVDREGRALAGVSVSVVGRAGSVTTASDGSFRLEPEPRRPFDLVAFDAAGIVLGSVRVDAESTNPLRLTPAGSESVRVVSGVAPSTSAPPAAAATVLSREQTERLQPARLVDALTEVPGADPVGSGQTAVPALRGLARGRTLLLIDDARVTTERRVGPSATYLDPFAIENVEIVRGPGSVAYGSDAIGGVLHVRTSRPVLGERTGRFEVAGGAGVPFGSVAAEVGVPLGEESALLLQGHGRRFGDYETPVGTEPNSASRDAGVLVRGLTARDRVRWNWGVQIDRGRDIERPADDTDRRVTIYPVEDSDRFTFGADVAGSRRWLATEVRAFVGRYRLLTERDTFATPTDPRNRTSADVESYDASLRATTGRRALGGTVRFGIDLVSRFGLEAVDRSVDLPEDGPPVVVQDENTIDSASRLASGLFVEVDRSFGAGGATLSLGARVDHVGTRNSGGYFGDRSTSNASPSGYVAVRVPIVGAWDVSLQAARGFRDPTLSDRYFRGATGRGTVTGNPDLEPETSTQFDLALRGTTGPVRLAVYGYLYRIADLIERYEVAPDEFLFRNRGEQELVGAELEADVVLGERLSGRATMQWARGEILDDGTAAADVAAPAATVSIDHRPTDRWWWRIAARYQARDDRPGEQEAVTPGFATLDLAAAFKPRPDLEIRLLLDNVLDRAYPSSSDRRAPLAAGLAASLAVTGRF